MCDDNRPVGSTFTLTEVDCSHLGVNSSNSLEFFSGDPRDGTVNSFNGGQVSSTAASVVGAHHGATSGFSYRHQHQVAPAVTAALAAVATSTAATLYSRLPPIFVYVIEALRILVRMDRVKCQYFYLFKHQWQMAHATYMPVKSITMHINMLDNETR